MGSLSVGGGWGGKQKRDRKGWKAIRWLPEAGLKRKRVKQRVMY